MRQSDISIGGSAAQADFHQPMRMDSGSWLWGLPRPRPDVLLMGGLVEPGDAHAVGMPLSAPERSAGLVHTDAQSCRCSGVSTQYTTSGPGRDGR